MNKSYYIFYLILTFLMVQSCGTEDYVALTGDIDGTVLNAATNEPIKGCQVISNYNGTKLTDDNGYFSFKDVEPGKLTLTYKASGFETATREINVTAGHTVSANITLEPAASETELQPDKTVLDFGSRTGVLNLILKNPTTHSINYTISSNAGWISTDPDHGSVLSERESTVKVSVNRDEISDGSYERTLSIETSSGILEILVLVDKGTSTRPVVNTISVRQNPQNYYSVIAEGAVTSVGSSSIYRHGFCYAIGYEPSLEENAGLINLGDINSPQDFSASIPNLEFDKEYYIRAFATNDMGTGYGEAMTIILHDIPQEVNVTTLTADEITSESALIKASISGVTFSSIKSFGFFYGDTPNCHNRIDQNIILNDDIFSVTITNLDSDTEYYFKGFIETDKGISYGEIKTFKTINNSSPDDEGSYTLITKDASNITPTSAELNGAISVNGKVKVKEYGFLYGTNSAPSLRRSIKSYSTYSDMSSESFSATVNDLKENTLYYFQSYIIDENNNVVKGNLLSFTTTITPSIEIDTVNYEYYSEGKYNITGEATLYPQGHTVIEAGFVYRASSYQSNLFDIIYNGYNCTSIQCEIEENKISCNRELSYSYSFYDYLYIRAYMILSDGTIIYGGPKNGLELIAK